MKIPMVLRKEIIFTRIYIVLMILYALPRCSYGHKDSKRHSNSSIKSMIVQEIMKKVSNITLNSLSKVPNEKKETILNKIENKLKQSAKAMGPDANKYVKFIMEEFKTKAFDKQANKTENPSDLIKKSISLRTNDKPVSRSVIDSETKQEIIKEIADKIQFLAQGYMKDAKTMDMKKDVLEKIKRRIMDSAKQKHMQIHTKHEELKAYSSLIAQGLEVSMRKLMTDEGNARRSDTQQVNITDHKSNDDIDVQQKSRTDDIMAKNAMLVFDVGEINKFKQLIEQTLNETSIDPRCDEIVEETCINIQSFNKISCSDGTSVPIENLCNGVIDCINKADEDNCTSQAMAKVRKATAVMTDIEASLNRKCFASTLDGNILSSQNQILRDVLQTQMDFLQKHVQAPLGEADKKDTNDNHIVDDVFIKKTVRDVNMILSTLSYALDGTLCVHRFDPDHTGNVVARKYNNFEIEDLLEGQQDLNWSPKSCTCKGEVCVSKSCDAPCKRVCWQKYSLNHWGCQAINGGTSVSLNVICDGKLDCFDETDESNCLLDGVSPKIDASSTYSNLLDLLSTKSRSYEFIKTRNKVVALHGLVRQIQKQTMKTNTDTHTIKSLRDEIFNLLVSIYDDLLHSVNLQELDDTYLILLSINEQLVTALKYTRTGNENLISPEGCYCRGGLCALRRCTKTCVQACLAEPVLTRFSCEVQNMSIPVETICNGKPNCPNGEDEKNCKKEVCRKHHLVVLRHHLQKVGINHKGTILGEVIDTWRTKVSAALYIAEETHERPNHQMMSETINKVLHDLVMAFAAMEDYRKTNSDFALKEFISISKLVMNTMKSCSN